MQKHENYHEIEAENNYELGLILGTKFKNIARRLVLEETKKPSWGALVDRSKEYLAASKKFFPDYVSELEGYAKGAEIDFKELWARSLEDELEEAEKCTTFATNGGATLAHNEDFDFGADPASSLCVLKKKIDKLTILEIYYFCTLGGNAVSVNSYGFAQAINSLSARDRRAGVPRNVIGRFISETKNPEADFKKVKGVPRASGLNHVILNRKGEVWNVESTASELSFSRSGLPFVHTNHYLSDLSRFEANLKNGTRRRYETAVNLVKNSMPEDEIKAVMNDTGYGDKESIMNRHTIAKAILDLKDGVAKIWLKRENEKGFIDYDLNF